MSTNQIISVVTNAGDIRDIKPPVDIPSGWEWLWWTLAGLVLAAVLYAAWRSWRKRQSQVPVVPPVPAHIRAKQKLQEALALIGQPKPFCILVSDTLRQYLEERFEFRAPERTTEEFLHELRSTDRLTRDQKDSLGDFLQRCDLVKFARFEPNEPELRDLHGAALRLVEETEGAPATETPPSHSVASEVSSLTIKHNARSANAGIWRGRTLAIFGTVLQLAPCIWVAMYFITLFRLFGLIRTPQPMNPDRPFDAINAAISEMSAVLSKMNSILSDALTLLLVGLILGVIGLVLLVISLTTSRYRAEWFFWFLMVYGAFLIGAFPIGTALGIFFVVYCLTHRRDFFNKQAARE